MPFDKVFETPEGNEELCHATGYEICLGQDPTDSSNWWNEYIDTQGRIYYGL